MKTWRLHFVWAAVTVVSCAAWSQRAVRAREVEFLEREKVLQVRIVEAKRAALPAQLPEREYQFQQEDDRPGVEELRRLVQGESNDAWRVYTVVSKMVKCPLKTELVQGLFRHRDGQIRRAVAYLLQEAIGPDAAAPLFQESLRSDPDAEVREAVATMLANGAPGNLEALLQAFQKDTLRIQVVCASALNDLGQTGPAAQMAPRIAARLDSPDGAVRREATELLSRLRAPQAFPALTRALGDSNGDVRLEAVNALYDLEDPQVQTLLEPLLNDPVAAVRDAVKGLLEELKRRKN
jgi:HEAT repeat protein